ncbi:MAG TPA: hypothetical protein VGW35_04780 [Methylomirabilota bacterium]|jgi:hypothetical protein|nr:hypothetical protein [Methylomirabilota bacterium]
MAEDWAKTVAKKVEGRVAEEAERLATQRKRFEDGVERFRKQLLDLVAAVNANIASETHRIQVIVLDNGIILAAAYKRVMTTEEIGATEGIPASVGKVTVARENRKALAAPAEPEEIYITTTGTQSTFYRRPAGQLKIMGDGEFRQLIEYFAN